MTHTHLSSEALRAYTQGDLAEAEEREIERASAGCAACARALRAEARLELSLPELGRQVRTRAWRPSALGAAALAAAAAAFVLWSGRSAPRPRGFDAAAGMLALIESEPDGQARDALIERALHAGFAVPNGHELLVPRYEDVVTGDDTGDNP